MKSLILALAIALPTVLSAQEFTEPIKYTWIGTSCETWDCAASAFVLAAGDKNTIVIPTGSEKRPWLVLRRVQAGSVYIPDDEPFTCDVFQTIADATNHFNTLSTCQSPMVMNMLDGKSIVTALAKCEPSSSRRRAASH